MVDAMAESKQHTVNVGLDDIFSPRQCKRHRRGGVVLSHLHLLT